MGSVEDMSVLELLALKERIAKLPDRSGGPATGLIVRCALCDQDVEHREDMFVYRPTDGSKYRYWCGCRWEVETKNILGRQKRNPTGERKPRRTKAEMEAAWAAGEPRRIIKRK